MPDQSTTEDQGVRDRAVDAAMAVFQRSLHLMSPHRHLVVEALDAAGEVFDADRDAAAERMAADTGLVSMEALPDQGVRLRIALGVELAGKMLGAFRELLDAHPAAVNYIEQEFISPDNGKSYVAIICRPDGQTPNQLRRAAERERDDLAKRLDAVHDTLVRIDDGDDDSFNTLESTAEYVVNRYRAVADSEAWAADEIQRLCDELHKIADLAYRAGPGKAAQDALAEIQTRARRAAQRQIRQPETEPSPIEPVSGPPFGR